MAVVDRNPMNNVDRKPPVSHSRFTPDFSIYATHRFADVSPFLAAEVVPKDKLTVRCATDLDSLSLKTPQMTPLKMMKTYFGVNNAALLPHTWELLETNPVIGDDIVAEDVNTVIKRFKIYNMLSTAYGNLSSYVYDVNSDGAAVGSICHYTHIFLRFYLLGCMFLSHGSVPALMGHDLSQMFRAKWKDANGAMHWLDFDEYAECFFNYYLPRYFKKLAVVIAVPTTTTIQTQTISVNVAGQPIDPETSNSITVHELADMISKGALVVNIDYTGCEFTSNYSEVIQGGSPILIDLNLIDVNYSLNPLVEFTAPVNDKYFNYGRCAAYQLCNAEFFTSDFVDNVYNAELYRQNQRSLLISAFGGTLSNNSFVINGKYYEYDILSGKNMVDVIDGLQAIAQSNPNSGTASWNYSWPITSISYTKAHYCLMWLANIFCIQRSLRYQDYFVGSRRYPLAVGDVSVGVDTGTMTVDVVDVTKKIQMQRFLNQVNRVGRKVKDYYKGIFDTLPPVDICMPFYLGQTVDTIGAEETQNTGAAQQSEANSITSRLRSNSQRYAFDINCNSFGYVIGVVTFDVIRPYVTAVDRPTFHVDRFDMFNPYMQFIGDQEVKGEEINLGQTYNFGYQTRYMEYRQRVDHATGGFVKFLPGFAFLNKLGFRERDVNGAITLSSDFIRNNNSEFDDFFIILPHYSLSGYFHFFARHDVKITADRPMAAAPQIL